MAAVQWSILDVHNIAATVQLNFNDQS